MNVKAIHIFPAENFTVLISGIVCMVSIELASSIDNLKIENICYTQLIYN